MTTGSLPTSSMPATSSTRRDRSRRLVRWLPASFVIGAMLVLTLGSGPAVLADTPTSLTVTFTANDLVYNGLTAATVSSCTITSDVSAHPNVTCVYAGASGTFADKNVGTGRAVTGSGFVPGGADAGFYTVGTVAATTANITPRALTVTATGVNRTYDRTTAATVTLSDNRVAGDVFTDAYATASFADKNAASAKPISVTGISITGTDAANYTFNTTATTAANITQAPLTVTAVFNNKVADGPLGLIDGLSASNLALLDEELALREFVPIIEKVVSVSGITEPCEWFVETNHGPTSFVLKTEEDVRRISAKAVNITDANGIRYRVDDMKKLDKRSRSFVEWYV